MSQVICAWCSKFIRRLDDPRTGTSHGICQSCLKQYFLKITLQEKKT